MKQKIITIGILLFVSMNFLFAAEIDRSNTINNEQNEVVYEQQETEPDQATPPQIEENRIVKTKAFKRLLRKKRLVEKFIVKNKQLTKSKIPVIFYIGAGLTLVGMILSFSGMYMAALILLIPALILLIISLFFIK